MEFGKVGLIGAILLAAYLIVVGIAGLIGGTAVPQWFVAIIALAAGALILVGK